jgi:hypothetical protein
MTVTIHHASAAKAISTSRATLPGQRRAEVAAGLRHRIGPDIPNTPDNKGRFFTRLILLNGVAGRVLSTGAWLFPIGMIDVPPLPGIHSE